MYPITAISIERNKLDPQLMMNPNIQGIEYQRGTLFGWQVRAYIMNRDQGRCVYCRRSNVRLQLDHVKPRAIGSDRVDNLVACCRDCNVRKDNRPIEQFLADQPELLKRILERTQRSDLSSAAHMNAALPKLIRELQATGLPLQLTDAASVSWERQQLNVRKTRQLTATTLPCWAEMLKQSKACPAGYSKYSPATDAPGRRPTSTAKGTPTGQPFRDQQRLPKHLRRQNPAAGHSDRRQRYGPDQIGTGDTIVLESDAGGLGRAVIKDRGTRVSVRKRIAGIARARLIARNPRHQIRWTKPSQQTHHDPDAVALPSMAPA